MTFVDLFPDDDESYAKVDAVTCAPPRLVNGRIFFADRIAGDQGGQVKVVAGPPGGHSRGAPGGGAFSSRSQPFDLAALKASYASRFVSGSSLEVQRDLMAAEEEKKAEQQSSAGGASGAGASGDGDGDGDGDGEGEALTGDVWAWKQLQKKGWAEGRGLGKSVEGIKSFITVKTSQGSQGLGHGATKRQRRDVTHIVDSEPIEMNEYLEWLTLSASDTEAPLPTIDDLRRGIRMGAPMLDPDYNLFCNKEMATQVFKCKSELDMIDRKDLSSAVGNANPYELVGRAVFQNRAAMKMANMDAVFKFTDEKFDIGGNYHFADICAGPGGFSEYVFWRRREAARGFGFTLKGDCDWRIDKFNDEIAMLATGNFKISYGADNTGDIYKNDNIKTFASFVLAQTPGGVALCMGDGGSDASADFNRQEVLMKRLVMCQFLTALSIIRQGGSFVCKLFDQFTPFVNGLLALLHRHFKRICIFKPLTSRPANSERYVICEGLLVHRPPGLLEFLHETNQRFDDIEQHNLHEDVVEVFRLADIPTAFIDYMQRSNIRIAKTQIKYLTETVKYYDDSTLSPVDQATIRQILLKRWGIPEKSSLAKTNLTLSNLQAANSAAAKPKGPEKRLPMAKSQQSIAPQTPSLGAVGGSAGAETSETPEQAKARIAKALEERRKRAQKPIDEAAAALKGGVLPKPGARSASGVGVIPVKQPSVPSKVVVQKPLQIKKKKKKTSQTTKGAHLLPVVPTSSKAAVASKPVSAVVDGNDTVDGKRGRPQRSATGKRRPGDADDDYDDDQGNAGRASKRSRDDDSGAGAAGGGGHVKIKIKSIKAKVPTAPPSSGDAMADDKPVRIRIKAKIKEDPNAPQSDT